MLKINETINVNAENVRNSLAQRHQRRRLTLPTRRHRRRLRRQSERPHVEVEQRAGRRPNVCSGLY